MKFLISAKEKERALAEGKKFLEENPDALEKGRKIIEEEKLKNPMPHCPSCGSTNIRRISSGEKIASTLALGIFSNKRKKQFQCLNPNCKYRW